MSPELEVIFSSVARVRILELFLLNPDKRYYQREIERETGQAIRAVQREMTRLTEIDLLSRSTEGNRVFYALNPEFPLAGELTGLFRAAFRGEATVAARDASIGAPPEASTISQPFPWMESPAIPTLPQSLRDSQVEGEWDQAF
ncbi:hypothetical protein ACFLUM_03180 [Chloroflexota bacterium]